MEQFENTMSIICDAVRSIRDDEYNRLKKDCIKTLYSGKKIIASGLGKNVPICEKFVGTLTSLGLSAAFMHTNSAVHGDIGMVRDGDLVIVLTKSGETAESVYLVNLLKERNCKIWLLSFSRDSTLYREVADSLIIELAHEGDQWNIVPNNSTVLNLIVLQELAMQIAEECEISIEALRMNHPGGNIGTLLSSKSRV
jgi:D-arabinose 5-phosphate isomerase GutQ